MLRICSDQTARTERHLVDLAQPDHALAGGQLIAGLDVIMPGLPSGQRVIAPREVDEMARTRVLPPLPPPIRMADHLGDLPARRGRPSACVNADASCWLVTADGAT